MPTCQHCNSDLSTISNLKAHQRTSKKCLKIQGIEPNIKYDCDICNKNFLNKVNLQRHIFSCMKNTKDIRDKIVKIEDNNASIIINSNEKYKELEFKYNSLNINSNEKYKELEKKLLEVEIKYNLIVVEKKILKQEYDNLFEKITTSALSKTNTVNKHNNTINISTYTRTDDEIKNIYDKNITAEHIEGGISSIAKFIVDKVITDNDGNKMITITDKSRGTARYKLPSGEVITDIGLNTFTTKNRDMVMKSIYNVCSNPELSSQIFDDDTRLCKGYNEISEDNDGDNLKRNLIKNIG